MSSTGDIDEFRLVRPLGRGGMGEVYLANDTILNRAVALKLVARTDVVGRERFLTEARAIARLNHPNVVGIYRVGTTVSGQAYIVQELIRGTGLDHVPRPLPWRTLCDVGIGVARGLDAAHRAGILHRDVKPANVMLDERNNVRLLDFGIAKLSPIVEQTPTVGVARMSGNTDVAETADPVPPDGVSELARSQRPALPPSVATEPAGLIGTPRYIAPEVWRGEPATERSDLYALGVSLYELATGTLPYPQPHVEALAAAIKAGGARPVGEVAELPEDLAALIMRCIAVDPSARPASAAELAHAIELIAADAPAVPEGNPYRGLAAFDAAHRGLFFGRGPDIRALLERLRAEPLVTIVGDSGIGKSSLCHAGVVPEIVAGGLGDQRRWAVIASTPGRTPWRSLCELVGGEGSLDHEPSPSELVRTLAQRPEGTGTLLVIDQAEELITVSQRDEAERVAAFLAAIAIGIQGLKVVLVVRGDFLTRVASLPGLGQPVARGVHLVRVLGRDDLREAVVGPARARGVAFESEAMVEGLVEAVATNSGALPLLQFALAALWDARDTERGVVTAAALQRLGGVDGALAGRADAVLLGLPADERAAACRALLRLVSSERTRITRDRVELGADDPVVAKALEALVHGRLVVARDSPTGAPSYEIAHEALIRSWTTLQELLDAAAGQHAVRNRLAAQAAEWHRLGRRGELLWTRRQLAEMASLDELSAAELAFVVASRRTARRRNLMRVVVVAGVLALALGSIAYPRITAARERARELDGRLAAATRHRAEADVLAGQAEAARRASFAEFDAQRDGEPAWREARRLAAAAGARYRDAAGELESASALDAAAVREPMAGVLVAHRRLAEAFRDRDRVEELARRLEVYAADSPPSTAALAIELDRPARISIHAYRDGRSDQKISGGFDAAAVATVVGTSLERTLPHGSYVAVIERDEHVVRDPVLLGLGERVVRKLAIPPARPGLVYVPAGRFVHGSSADETLRVEFQGAQPERESELKAYWIQRTEVTFGDWLAYLRAVAPAEAELRRQTLAKTESSVALEPVPGGGFELVMQPSSGHWVRAREGVELVYPKRSRRARVRWERMPVSGVLIEDVVAYAAWLDKTGALPGARMCTSLEWERAARGADGRLYPHGATLAPDDANFDETYGRTRYAFGPDEVGSHPASDSPFGLSDMIGNVWELTVAAENVWAKGGCFYHDRVSAIPSNQFPTEPSMRTVRHGFRLCAGAAR